MEDPVRSARWTRTLISICDVGLVELQSPGQEGASHVMHPFPPLLQHKNRRPSTVQAFVLPFQHHHQLLSPQNNVSYLPHILYWAVSLGIGFALVSN